LGIELKPEEKNSALISSGIIYFGAKKVYIFFIMVEKY